MGRRALVVIDLQHDYFADDGLARARDGLARAVNDVDELVLVGVSTESCIAATAVDAIALIALTHTLAESTMSRMTRIYRPHFDGHHLPEPPHPRVTLH